MRLMQRSNDVVQDLRRLRSQLKQRPVLVNLWQVSTNRPNRLSISSDGLVWLQKIQ